MPLLIVFLIMGHFAAFLVFINWSVHKSMVEDGKTPWDYGTFEQFKEEFVKKTWEANIYCQDSLSDSSTRSEIHLDIIQFDGKRMKLGFFAYCRFKLFITKHLVHTTNRKPGLWDKT